MHVLAFCVYEEEDDAYQTCCCNDGFQAAGCRTGDIMLGTDKQCLSQLWRLESVNGKGYRRVCV